MNFVFFSSSRNLKFTLGLEGLPPEFFFFARLILFFFKRGDQPKANNDIEGLRRSGDDIDAMFKKQSKPEEAEAKDNRKYGTYKLGDLIGDAIDDEILAAQALARDPQNQALKRKLSDAEKRLQNNIQNAKNFSNRMFQLPLHPILIPSSLNLKFSAFPPE